MNRDGFFYYFYSIMFKYNNMEKDYPTAKGHVKGAEDVLQERLKQFTTNGKTAKFDADNNGAFQLVTAAQILSNFKMTMDSEFNVPFNWDEEKWVKLCRKPYIERLAISGALLMAEIDRVEYMEAQKMEVDPIKANKKETLKS